MEIAQHENSCTEHLMLLHQAQSGGQGMDSWDVTKKLQHAGAYMLLTVSAWRLRRVM